MLANAGYKNTNNTRTKHNPEKTNNAKQSKTKLPWFSRFLRHSASKQGGPYSTTLTNPHGATKIRCYITVMWCVIMSLNVF